MRKTYKDTKIALYGSAKEIEQAEKALDRIVLIWQESKDRLVIQKLIDDANLKADVLYDGNTVRPFKKTVTALRSAIKNGSSKMSDLAYKFLHLCCWTIAHYNKQWRASVYPSVIEVLKRNEFGTNAISNQPWWKTDAIRILEQIFEEFKLPVPWY